MGVQEYEGPTRTFRVSAALKDRRRVRLDAGKLAYAGAADADALGITMRETFSADERVAVKTPHHGFSQKMTAAGAIAVGAPVYAAADGKVDDAGTVVVGIALTAAGADNDYIEVATG